MSRRAMPAKRAARRPAPPATPPLPSPEARARDAALSARGRVAALVIAAAGLLAMLAPWLVATLGLPIRFEMLFYFAALAGFVWAMAVTYQVWRARRG